MGSLVMEPADMVSYTGNTEAMRNFTTICIALGRIRSSGVLNGKNPLQYTFPLLLVQLSMASTVIVLAAKFLRPLGQPTIIPQILGGIILGPSVLGQSSIFTSSFFPLRSFIVLDAISTFGYMFYFFLIGVQTDPCILKKIEKKTFIIGISTVGVPLVLSTAASIFFTHLFKIDVKIGNSLPLVSLMQSVLSFPIITQYLTELKIVNSEFGRVAMVSSAVSNIFSFCVITLTVLMKESTDEKFRVAKTISIGIIVAGVIAFVLRPVILYMIRKSPEGRPLKEDCICVVFVGVLVTGFCSQATGLHIFFGPLIFGMAIPAGPPLGSALVEKLEVINSWLFMPLFFVKNGLAINTFGVNVKDYVIVQCIILISCFGKFVGSFVTALHSKMPAKDAVSLGLVMNAQGILELGLFKMMKNSKAISTEAFVVMCTSMVIVMAIITPLIRYLYDPSRRYIVYKKRTVMNSRLNSVLRLLVCINEKDNVPAIINLLEALNPSNQSPIEAYVLHLIELIGQTNPLLISHRLTKRSSARALLSEHVVNALRHYEQSNHGVISVQAFTAISTYSTMHDNVCTMALDKRTSLIIVPYHKLFTINAALKSSNKGTQIMNNQVLDEAPCSVAILIDRGLFLHTSRSFFKSWSPYRVAVIFLGGADDREALAIATRMAGHPNINLTVIRLLENGNIGGDDTGERKLDNELVSEFRLSMTENYRFVYVEEVVMDGSGTVAVIRSMENKYELIMVGRIHLKNSALTLGLNDWNDQTELGEIGDVLASADFLGNTTVLVVQQHRPVVGNGRNEEYGDKHREQTLNIFHDFDDEEAEDIPIQKNSV